MREIPEPKILSENDDVHVVQLSAAYPQNKYDSLIETCVATVSERGCRLNRMSNDGKPKKFSLSMEEMDVLCQAWSAFKDKQEKAIEAEVQRQQAMVDEAYAIAKEHPEIEIKEQCGSYDVRVPSIRFRYQRYAYGSEELLKQVEGALEALELYQASANA